MSLINYYRYANALRNNDEIILRRLSPFIIDNNDILLLLYITLSEYITFKTNIINMNTKTYRVLFVILNDLLKLSNEKRYYNEFNEIAVKILSIYPSSNMKNIEKSIIVRLLQDLPDDTKNIIFSNNYELYKNISQ